MSAFEEFLINNGLDEAVAQLLISEGFTSRKDLANIKADVLRVMGLKGRDIAAIIKISEMPIVEEESVEKDIIEMSLSEEESLDDSEDDYERALSPYFTHVEFKELSCYDKVSMFNMLKRYKKALEVPEFNAEKVKPIFVIQWEQRQKKTKKNTGPNQQDDSIPSTSGTQAISCTDNSNNPSTSSGERAACLGQRVTRAKGAAHGTNQTRGAPAFEVLSGDQIEAIKPTLPKYDVKAILDECASGKFKKNEEFLAMYQKLQAAVLVDGKHRKFLVRILVRHLHKDIANIKDVTPQMKEGMAKSLLVAFPNFCGPRTDGRTPWSHFFDGSNVGFVANASRKFQKENPQRTGRKRNKAPENEDVSVSNQAENEMIEDLSLLCPIREHKPEIMEKMAQTFSKRCALRNKGVLVKQMLSSFPHLANFDGEVLHAEFLRMKPNAKDFCRIFNRLLPNILALPCHRTIKLDFEDDVIQAMVLLSQNLPHDIPYSDIDGESCFAVVQDILCILKNTDNVEDFVLDRLSNATETVQPYLILIKHPTRNAVVRTFLVLDTKPMQLASCPTVKALDWLFQAYFVFHLKYPLGWRNSFHFLATCFYEIFEDVQSSRTKRYVKDAVSPSEVELWNKINSASQ